jgi:hypothetical protein
MSTLKALAATAAAVALCGAPARATAQPLDTCARAYEEAQEARAAGHLLSSLEQLKRCVAPACAEFMRADCGRWMDEVEPAIPSIVFAVRRSGHDVTGVEVQVSCDGTEVKHALDGKAITVDPGPHTFSFVTADDDAQPVTTDVTIREGERNRLIEIELPPIRPVRRTRPRVRVEIPAASPRVATAPRSRGPFVAAAVGGVAGVAGFATFALLGRSQETSLSNRCAPNCSSSDVASVRLKYELADVSLGLGLVAAGVGTYLFFARPSRTDTAAATPPSALALAPLLYPSGGGVGAHGSF